MANILYICTATSALYMGYSKGGVQEFGEIIEGQRHASEVNASLGRLMKSVDLNTIDAIAVSEGPGSYTGLRVGMAFAKALVISVDAELMLMDSLQLLRWTQDLNSESLYFTSIDARREDVFACMWEDAYRKVIETQPISLNETDVLDPYKNKNVILLGSGAQKSLPYFENGDTGEYSDEDYLQSMKNLSQWLWENQAFSDLVSAHPNYGKAPYVTTPKKRF